MSLNPCTLTVNAKAASPEHAVRILRCIADDMEAQQELEIPLPHRSVCSGSIQYDWKLEASIPRLPNL